MNAKKKKKKKNHLDGTRKKKLKYTKLTVCKLLINMLRASINAPVLNNI